MFQLLYLNTYSRDLVWPIAVRYACDLLPRKSAMKQKQKQKTKTKTQNLWKQMKKKDKKGIVLCLFTEISWAVQSFIATLISIKSLQRRRLLWNTESLQFISGASDWSYLHFQKWDLQSTEIKLKHPEKTLHWGWVHALFLPPRTQAVFFNTGQKGKCLLPVKFQQTEGRLNYWACMHIENKH